MAIVGAVAVPHPPVIVPAVGRGRESALGQTDGAYRQAARCVARWHPDTLVVISPHAPGRADGVQISPGEAARGDLAAFGAPEEGIEVCYDGALRACWLQLLRQAGLPAEVAGREDKRALDHGTLIPLLYLRRAGVTCPVLRVGISGLPGQTHWQIGRQLARAAQQCGRRVAVVASGDLSHKLKADGPYGFAPEGPAFDRQCTAALAAGDWDWLLTVPPAFCRRAAECGLRSFQMMAGALDGLKLDAQCLSYEGPFGVGYAVAVFAPREGGDAFVQLARLALEEFVRTGRQPPLSAGLPTALTRETAGVFVSLYRAGRLRGCIGTIAPATASVAQEIVRNAVLAGTRDPRFPAVGEAELPELTYSVDVLGPLEPVAGLQQLDPRRYGVVVRCGQRRGLLLPDLDGVDTVEKQIRIAREKGGIGREEGYTLARFEVVRHR